MTITSSFIVLGTILALGAGDGHAQAPVPADPFLGFSLPAEWEARFWASPDAQALFALEAKALAELVPVQAGIRFCRCPACDASEADDTLAWSVAHPKTLTCKRCGVTIPNDKFPAHPAKKDVPEEKVEVRPGVIHTYPYHEVELPKQRYGGERLYLAAKRDYEAREFLSKAALYAALRHRRQSPGRRDPALARAACVLLVRFAQVYPSYAAHYDQPSSPKYFQKADLQPPYRRGYATAKWDWTGSLNVPLNLVVAYALLRGDPALAEAGKLLDEPEPGRLIEHDLFRASAEFVRRQPEDPGEPSLEADRGILAVGRLLNDPALVRDALDRLDRFSRRGFSYDGFWRQGTLSAHRRVIAQFDGWIGRLLGGEGAADLPMLAQARSAGSVSLAESRTDDVQLASWPAASPATVADPRIARLLGGTGLARLALGQGDDAFDLELRGLDTFGPGRIHRQALRIGVGGKTILGDLDELPGMSSGFDHASVSRNTVVVDGLNQRETLVGARQPSPGGDFVFFAADPDFQVVSLDDPRSYPETTTRYRQTLVASAAGRLRYALGVFEVHGGRQHDQLFHAPAGSPARWRPLLATSAGPESLLSPSLAYVPTAKAGDDRWFVQAYGEFSTTGQARFDRPTQASLVGPTGGLKIHLLGDAPATLITALGPDPTLKPGKGPADGSGRSALLLRRVSDDGPTLRTTFVTVFEPVSGSIAPLEQVVRVTSPPDTVVVAVNVAGGGEYLMVNFAPGKAKAVKLPDGQTLKTDGLAVRVSRSGMTLAGGTFAEFAGRRVEQSRDAGKIVGANCKASLDSRGWFDTDAPLPDPKSLAGRVLLIRHGDGTTHGWTISRVDNQERGARIFVREEPRLSARPSNPFRQFLPVPLVRDRRAP